MSVKTKAATRLSNLKQELDSLYFTAEYDRLKAVIDGIRLELERRKAAKMSG